MKNHTDKSSTSFWETLADVSLCHFPDPLGWFATKPSIDSSGESLGAPPGSLPGCWGPAPPLPPPTSKALLKANCAAHFPEFLLKTHSKTHQKGQSPTVLLVCIRHGCCPGLVSAAERGGGWRAVTVTLRSPAKSLRAAGCGHRCVAQKERQRSEEVLGTRVPSDKH